MKFEARLVLLTRAVENPNIVNLHFRPTGVSMPQMVIPATPEEAYALEFGALYSFDPVRIPEPIEILPGM